MHIIQVKASPELYALIAKEADKDAIPMNEWFVRVAAASLGRPELGKVPRKRMGRPRKALAS